MPGMSVFVQKIIPKRPLYLELLFTALAFLAMVILSYYSIKGIVNEHLTQNAQSMLDSTQSRVTSELLEPRITLTSFSRTIRNMIFSGMGIPEIQAYINDLSGFIINMIQDGQEVSSFDGIYFYFETTPGGPVFINSMGWTPPEGYNLKERRWYQHTVEARNNFMETLAYPDESITGETIIIYSRCIHDDNDQHLGVVGLRSRMSVIGRSVVNVAQLYGGYGMLVSEDYRVLAHPNPAYINKNLRDPEIGVPNLVDKLEEGKDISEYELLNYKGEISVVFSRRLPNGWYLGLVTPKSVYYESVTRMMFILSMLGAALAIVVISILIRIDTARKKSDIESRHKSAFLANMSHEIRTPMNAIIGMTTIGKSAADIERKDYCFTKIQDASNHLLGVINDILDMSKIEANKFDLSPQEFNVEKMLQRVVNVINFRMDEKQQRFTVHIDPAIPKTLIADDQRLAQVITNLLGNAIKFTPKEGFITLDARFAGEENGLCTVQFSISDTGIGVSPEQQLRLFDSFEQAESSTTRKYGGTGLGLAISKGIVELMGGTIWVESGLGKGSTFFITIQARRGSKRSPRLLSGNVNWGNVRVLAVDDDPDILDYFRETVQGLGLPCDTALSGEEALKLVKQGGAYHIYFVDWKMPGMDGIQLAHELKTHISKKSVVIMISAAEWSVIMGEAKLAGVDKFLSKPLFPSAIAEIINECLDMSKHQAEEEHTDISGLFAGRRILLAEDVDINREIVQTLLEPTGIEIDCAENGAEAVRMFSEAPQMYDIIFMDLQMPIMDGYEATRCIRAMNVPGAKTVRIIAMTANVFKEDIEKCLEAGMDNHLGKPLDFNEVMEKLCIYLPQEIGDKGK